MVLYCCPILETVRLHNLPRCVFCGLVLFIGGNQSLDRIRVHLHQGSNQTFLVLSVHKHIIDRLSVDALVAGNERAIEQSGSVLDGVDAIGELVNLEAVAFSGFGTLAGESQLVSVLAIGGMKVDNLSSQNKCSPL